MRASELTPGDVIQYNGIGQIVETFYYDKLFQQVIIKLSGELTPHIWRADLQVLLLGTVWPAAVVTQPVGRTNIRAQDIVMALDKLS